MHGGTREVTVRGSAPIGHPRHRQGPRLQGVRKGNGEDQESKVRQARDHDDQYDGQGRRGPIAARDAAAAAFRPACILGILQNLQNLRLSRRNCRFCRFSIVEDYYESLSFTPVKKIPLRRGPCAPLPSA